MTETTETTEVRKRDYAHLVWQGLKILLALYVLFHIGMAMGGA